MARFLEKLADDGFGQHLDMNPSVSRTFTMSVAMDNAAFEAGDLDSEEELPRLIKEVASRVASGS